MTRVYQKRSDPDSILPGFRGCSSLRTSSLNYQDSIYFLFPLAARCVIEIVSPACYTYRIGGRHMLLDVKEKTFSAIRDGKGLPDSA